MGRAVTVIYFRDYYYLKAECDSLSGNLSEGACISLNRNMYTEIQVAAGYLHRPPDQRTLDINFPVRRTDLLISIF